MGNRNSQPNKRKMYIQTGMPSNCQCCWGCGRCYCNGKGFEQQDLSYEDLMNIKKQNQQLRNQNENLKMLLKKTNLARQQLVDSIPPKFVAQDPPRAFDQNFYKLSIQDNTRLKQQNAELLSQLNKIYPQMQFLSQKDRNNLIKMDGMANQLRIKENQIKALNIKLANSQQLSNNQPFSNNQPSANDRKQIEEKNKQINELKLKIEQVKKAMPKAQDRIVRLFQGSILQSEEIQKEFLLQQLENKFGFRITKTNLLYTFDLNNKTNFHKYIDDRKHIVVVIKSSSDYLFGAYSEPAFSERVPAQGRGLIFSLTNRRAFQLLHPNNKPISYDPNYLIFGNNQIRLKHLENKVFSNFGISNSYYNSEDQTTHILYGSQQKEQKIVSYEIYSLQVL